MNPTLMRNSSEKNKLIYTNIYENWFRPNKNRCDCSTVVSVPIRHVVVGCRQHFRIKETKMKENKFNWFAHMCRSCGLLGGCCSARCNCFSLFSTLSVAYISYTVEVGSYLRCDLYETVWREVPQQNRAPRVNWMHELNVCTRWTCNFHTRWRNYTSLVVILARRKVHGSICFIERKLHLSFETPRYATTTFPFCMKCLYLCSGSALPTSQFKLEFMLISTTEFRYYWPD